jgi:hypothetical protein
MSGMVDGINHILLGIDNTDAMGQVLNRRVGHMYVHDVSQYTWGT